MLKRIFLVIVGVMYFNSSLAGDNLDCRKGKEKVSSFILSSEGAERKFNLSAYNLIKDYCDNSERANDLRKSLSEKTGDGNKNGVGAIYKSVDVVSKFLKGKSEIREKEVFSYILKHYQGLFGQAKTKEEKNDVLNSFAVTSSTTVEILVYYSKNR